MNSRLIGSTKKIGELELKNRLVMAPMGIGLANLDGTASDEIIAYYKERAKGGAGLIFTEVTRINDEHGAVELKQLSVSHDGVIERLKKMTDAVHEFGSKLFIQLHHPGRQTYSVLIGGQPVVAPSAISCGVCQQETRELTYEEIQDLIQDYIKGAKRAKAGGADGVEIHGAHGYLVDQFLSPHTNKRTDQYGGSFENRLRFLEEIIVGIKKECGSDFPVSVRLSVDECYAMIGMPGVGIDLTEGIKIAAYAEKIGADAISVSTGTYETMNWIVEPVSFAQGWRDDIIKAVKAAVSVPVIGVSVIREPEYAEKLLQDGTLDFVGMGRSWLADPEWGNKAIAGNDSEIRKCINCLYCFETLLGGILTGGHAECALNARLGIELLYPDPVKNGNGRHVVVVGGGPGGLESARILGIKGFKVTLLEKADELGGQVVYAAKPPKKEKMLWLVDYFQKQLKDLGVDIKLGTTATVDIVKALDPYAVVIATGASPAMPASIKGIDSPMVSSTFDVLSGKVKIENAKVSVIGSGLTGLETAEFLAEQGNKVIVYEMQEIIGQGTYIQNLLDVTAALDAYGVPMLPGHKLVEIKEDRVVLEKTDGNKVEEAVDAVVIAMGVKPEDALSTELKKEIDKVFVVGDAGGIGKIAHAVQAGFKTAYELE